MERCRRFVTQRACRLLVKRRHGNDVYGLYHYRAFICFSTDLDEEGFEVPIGSVTVTFHVDDAGTPVVDTWQVEE